MSRPQVLNTLQRCQIGMANILNVAQYNMYDNLATKVYEYMSLGIPVILSKTPYNNGVMEEYRFGISVEPDNLGDISSAMTYLLDHPDEARQMGENGRRAVREKEAENLLALYAEIAQE